MLQMLASALIVHLIRSVRQKPVAPSPQLFLGSTAQSAARRSLAVITRLAEARERAGLR